MSALQMCVSLPAVIRTVLMTGCLLRSVRADGADSTEQLDIKYVLIGGGIGMFLAAIFIIVMICIIRKHVRNNDTGGNMKRPSQVSIKSYRFP
ncbi:transmembrane protein 273-like isoform X2 [Plectropomus leopardus]|uniref:transmembrane protein 273-like isoform X2 n=1 Tax=Plectropomus leopardus TaxID=160734 RepID=UPI001C4DC675|nr:transmembrane protein 273-like isoform X2 [Plectropomus leopardus]